MEGLAAGAAQIEEGIMRASAGLLRQNEGATGCHRQCDQG